MQICNTPQIKYCNNPKPITLQNNKSAKTLSEGGISAQLTSPIYYTPNFKSTHLDDEPIVKLSEEEFEALKEELKTLDQKETFDRLNIKYKEDERGNLTLEHFMCPIYKSGVRINMHEFELDIDRLFENVVDVEGDVDLNSYKFSPFKALKHIGGDLYCCFSDTKNFGSLEKVDGLLCADGAKLEGLGALQEAGYISLDAAEGLKSLSNLKRAGMCIDHTQISDVSSLEECDEMSAIDCPIPQKQKDYIMKLTKGNCRF